MPEISVIIPVYNVENKIRKCLESLIGQTFLNFELILVDDGSCDLSGNICDEFAQKDNRIRVIHQKNNGVSVARNNGIDNAKGKYITFVDSDDYVEKDYLQVLYNGMANNEDMAICGVFFCSVGSTNRISQKGYEDFKIVLHQNNTECVADLLRNRRFNYVYGKMYRRDIINQYQLRFCQEIVLGEDTIFVMDYLRHADVINIIGQAYYNYVKYQEGTLTTRFYDNLFGRYMLINSQIKMLFEEKGMLDSYIIDALDLRILYASIWSITEIRRQKNVCLKKRLEMLKEILYTEELNEALKRNNKLEQEYHEIRIMRKKSPFLLMIYYIKTEVIIKKIKIIVVKVVPKRWIRKVKQWMSSAQSLFQRIMQKNI